MDFKSIKKKIFISIIIGIAIFATLSIYSDFTKITKIFLIFDYKYLPLILILAPLNYFFRYIKWEQYIFVCILCSILAFGNINEARVYVILIPFLIFFHLDFYEKRI